MTGKILKIGADTGKTLRRRKVLTKAVKKQIAKHIRELKSYECLAAIISLHQHLQMAPKVQGTRNDSIHRVPPSFLSAKTLQHCKHTGLNQAYFTRSLIINTFFASLPGVNFIRKKARVCGSIASLLYAVCLYRAYGRWTLSLHIYIMNS